MSDIKPLPILEGYEPKAFEILINPRDVYELKIFELLEAKVNELANEFFLFCIDKRDKHTHGFSEVDLSKYIKHKYNIRGMKLEREILTPKKVANDLFKDLCDVVNED